MSWGCERDIIKVMASEKWQRYENKKEEREKNGKMGNGKLS
jgi:hypothetical protein